MRQIDSKLSSRPISPDEEDNNEDETVIIEPAEKSKTLKA